MKIAPTEIKLENDKLFLEGRDVFSELFERVRKDETLIAQRTFTVGLPEEDITPGHVVPATIVTVSGSS